MLLAKIPNEIYDLTEHEYGRITDSINKLVKKHDDYMRDSGREVRYGFIFDGYAYRMKDPPVLHQNLFGLDYRLNDEMEAILEEWEQINVETRQFRQMLSKMVVIDDQTTRDTLPEFLVNLVPHLACLPRLNQEACTIADNPSAMRQYQKLRPRMEFYAATRLIY